MPPVEPGKLVAEPVPQAEIDQFYRQIAAGQADEARETLARARRDNPGWTPPPDMAAQLETAEGQRALDSALTGGDVAAARSVAALAACAAAGSGPGGVGSAMRPFAKDQPYYPATLHMMALLAQVSHYPTCVPL